MEEDPLRDPYFGGEGPDRTGCNRCGGCMVGCRHGAKNTLDRNYLWLAERRGLRIEAVTEVTWIRPGREGGYEVSARQGRSVLRRRTLRWTARFARRCCRTTRRSRRSASRTTKSA